MKDLLKNAFPLYGKFASTLKNLKISEKIEKTDVHQQEYISSLKIDFPQIGIIVSTWRKTNRNKTILFPVDKILVSTIRNKGLAEKYVPFEKQTVSNGSSRLFSEKMKENWFHQSENQVHKLKYALSFMIGFHQFL